jgi:hypothetical protein
MTNTVNVDLFRKVMVQVYRDPNTWDQTQWGRQPADEACKSSHCFAGHAVILAGAEPIWTANSVRDEFGAHVTTLHFMDMVRTPDGEVHYTSVYGRQVLGLNHAQSKALFNVRKGDAAWDLVADLTEGQVTKEKIAALVAEEDRALLSGTAPKPAEQREDVPA